MYILIKYLPEGGVDKVLGYWDKSEFGKAMRYGRERKWQNFEVVLVKEVRNGRKLQPRSDGQG